MGKHPNWGELVSYYFDKPIEFVEDMIGATPTKQQKKVLTAYIEDGIISVKSGHGVGKTATLSWIILHFMFTRPNCRIPCTASSQSQLDDMLWPELAKWYNRSKLSEYELFKWEKRRFYYNDKKLKKTWFAVPRSTNKPDNLSGFHADEVLYIIDEAAGVASETMETIEGALTNDGAKLIMCGNPTRLEGMFYDAFHSDEDFFTQITLSSAESDLASEDYVKRIYGKYGENSNVARVRVRGEFPTQEEDTVIPINLLEKAAAKTIETVGNVVHIGVDVARYGNDESAWYVRKENKILQYHTKRKNDTMFVVNKALNLAKQYSPGNKIKIKVDKTGMGSGVIDSLKEKIKRLNMNKVEVFGIDNNQKAKNEEEYANAITEMYFSFADTLKVNEVQIPDDETLKNQLASRKYEFDSDGRFKVESKDSYKKRVGNSPDRGDGLLLCFYTPKQTRKRAGAW